MSEVIDCADSVPPLKFTSPESKVSVPSVNVPLTSTAEVFSVNDWATAAPLTVTAASC